MARISLRASLLWYFFPGTVLIASAKLAFPGVWGAAIAVGIAAAFIALKCWGHWRDKGRDASLAGDEIYYLGLLFTLVSLILAILQLFALTATDAAGTENLQERTNALIGNFGIALTSTVFGILGRILLQGRGASKPGEPEGSARPSLADDIPTTTAAERMERMYQMDQLLALRRSMFEATDAFIHFTRMTFEQAEGTRASAGRVIEDFSQQLTTMTRTEVQGIAALWREALDAMHTEHQSTVDRIRQELLDVRQSWAGFGEQAQTHIEGLVKRFDAAADALDRAEAGWSRLTDSLTGSADAVRLSSAAHSGEMQALMRDLSGMRQHLQPFSNALTDAGKAVSELQGSVQKSMRANGDLGQLLQATRQTLQALNDTAGRVDTDLTSRVGEMAEAHGKLVDGCTDLVVDVDALCRTALEAMENKAQGASEAVQELAGEVESLQARIKELADQLGTLGNPAGGNAPKSGKGFLQRVLRRPGE